MSKRPEQDSLSIMRMCERVAEVWYGSGRPGDDATCVGIVAALCLMIWPSYVGPETSHAEAMIASASDERITDLIAQAVAVFWYARPELAHRARPLWSWLESEPRDPTTIRAAGQVARACIKAGLWSGRFGDHDVLGTLYSTALRPSSARRARGEFYTPVHVCRMMAGVILADKPAPGQSIMDPCAGCGGMLFGAAQHLREIGQDPHDFWWFAADISAISVAALAVNVHLWDLGRRVVLGVADTLAEGDWEQRAIAEQNGAIEHRNSEVRAYTMLGLIRSLERTISGEAEPDPEPELPAIEPPAPARRWTMPTTGEQEALF